MPSSPEFLFPIDTFSLSCFQNSSDIQPVPLPEFASVWVIYKDDSGFALFFKPTYTSLLCNEVYGKQYTKYIILRYFHKHWDLFLVLPMPVNTNANPLMDENKNRKMTS